MRTVVRKYGGSSLATVAKVRRVAGQVARVHRAGHRVVVVVSARGDTTDELLRLAAEVGGGGPARDLDQLLATGECASAALLALALRARGVPAASLTGPQAGVSATGAPGAGRITAIRPERIRCLLAERTVVVVAGFQGGDGAGDVVTLGRGGSDTSAVALAAALDAGGCDIYTDVDGVFTADPRVVADARLHPELDVATMAEMAFAGARVVHPHAVELAGAHGVELRVGDSWSGNRGSVVRPVHPFPVSRTGGRVVGVVHDLDVAGVMIRARGDGQAARSVVFDVLASSAVPVDLVCDSGCDERAFRMRFTVRRGDLPALRPALRRALVAVGGTVAVSESVGKLSLVGHGLLDRADPAARMAAALVAAGITTRWACVSQHRASVVTPLDQTVDAVRLLHREFRLGQSRQDGAEAS